MGLVDTLLERLDIAYGERRVWSGRTPNGWRVVLTDATLNHILIEEQRVYVDVQEIANCLTNPTAIYLDARSESKGRKYWVLRQIADPHGRHKIKHFAVMVKRCRKLGFFSVVYVSTAHRISRLNRRAIGKRVWAKG